MLCRLRLWTAEDSIILQNIDNLSLNKIDLLQDCVSRKRACTKAWLADQEPG